MKNILNLLEHATSGTCYKSYRYCADTELTFPSIAYDEVPFTIMKNRYGETDTALKKTKDLSKLAAKISNDTPLFRYFLDGSRRTYKVDDIEINRRIYPIMAGQIGVACCERKSPTQFKSKELESSLVIALPTEANPEVRNSDLFFNNLTEKINGLDRVSRTGIRFSKILTYSSIVTGEFGVMRNENMDGHQDIGNKYEFLGIAAIQDEMIDNEKKIVSSLTTRNLLNESKYLMKDGSLQYKPMTTGEYRELSKIRNNYRWVVGVSKLFNPEFSKDRSGKSNAATLANLPLYHRTPAYMHEYDYEQKSRLGDYKFSIWYVRIRDRKRTDSPFAGILKLEKILITESELEYGLDTEVVDVITANVINERNPVCYGKDSRWANHLYPVYLTEQFLKSRYMSDLHFLNLF